jgi:hypothetical protein
VVFFPVRAIWRGPQSVVPMACAPTVCRNACVCEREKVLSRSLMQDAPCFDLVCSSGFLDASCEQAFVFFDPGIKVNWLGYRSWNVYLCLVHKLELRETSTV